MTEAVARILDEIERLTEAERGVLLWAMLERRLKTDELVDEDFAAHAANSFQALDDEERVCGERLRDLRM